uniref:probable multidrug resistance-associated protein lethal(2)03659 isoform X3 n=1 Tax=Vespula vulgaris TaxID=7454 RepID=UPI00223B708F|nr:probable multidrug resistance-associated protein lethal(2)03659 isoform X3 [Vespula vulgaris]
MDKNERSKVKNPREQAGFLSIVTFKWIFKTFLLGYKRELQETDLYSPLKEHQSNLLGDCIVKIWEDEERKCRTKKNGSTPRLYKVLTKCFGRNIMLIGIALAFIEFISRIAQPLILGHLLHLLSTKKEEVDPEIYYYAIVFILLPFMDCFIFHLTLQELMHFGMKMKVACCTLIYRKMLRLSNSVFEDGTSAGQMINLMSNDASRLDYITQSIHYMWIGPIQTLIIACILYWQLGAAPVAGLVLFLFFIPLQGYIGKRAAKLMLLSAQRTDERLRLMNELIAGVQIIKMYAWEIPFSQIVEKTRKKEMNTIKKYSIVQQIGMTFESYVPRICLFISILTYVVTGNYITAEKVFMITSFFNVIRNSMTIGFPLSIHLLVEGLASMRRIERFMMHTEIEKSKEKTQEIGSHEVVLKNVTAKWSDESKEDTLNSVNLSIEPASLVAIVGKIGSGKSSLLQVILQELPLKKGSLKISGKIAYVSQQPWIFASSIRQNILFGRSMDKSRYEQTIQVCQLNEDIASFLHGDRTVVGEKGISLSGGQRARINLARAVYADADVYLLDDPLSAVDARVGRRIVEDCICGYLKNKTRILVTHQLQFLRCADQVIVMHNGSVQTKGDFNTLEASGMDFNKFVIEERETKLEKNEEFIYEGKIDDFEGTANKHMNETSVPVVAEMRTIGHISAKVYVSYFKASRSVLLLLLMVTLFVSYQMAASGGDYFVAYWVNIEETSWIISENDTLLFKWKGPLNRMEVIYIYSGLTALTAASAFLQMFSFYEVCMRSSRNLHASMFRSIVRTSMYFFNNNPLGRILNRFSKDTGALDTRMPICMFDIIIIGLGLTAVITIVGSVNPWLLIPVVFITIIIYFLRNFYMATSRSVKRLEGIIIYHLVFAKARSPVFDHVSATLQGLVTIRALNAEEILISEFDNHQDLHSSAWFIFISASRAFGIYIELVSLVYNAIIIAFFLFLKDTVVSDVGLVITQITTLIDILQWGVRQSVEVENLMTSTERILEYSHLEEEPMLDNNPKCKPSKDWPKCGLVEFKNVKLKYGPIEPYVLKDITFTISPREKIGIVGRTGSGKSSLINALFRLFNVEGEICIDGIPTSSISLHDFRSKISIIPQEPILFSGSLRRNLDPFEEYSDHALWQALQEVELRDIIEEMAAGLNSRVFEGGMNFSVGQRQLLCLARAIIRNNRIIVLDEATANVDLRTDLLIQQTVRNKFKDCSVLTIAHRLNTIMDSDKILVMDAGHLVEFDHPYVLLQNNSYFYHMVQQTGSTMATTLMEIAKKNYSVNDNRSSQ